VTHRCKSFGRIRSSRRMSAVGRTAVDYLGMLKNIRVCLKRCESVTSKACGLANHVCADLPWPTRASAINPAQGLSAADLDGFDH
jgi:hypothetical protein